MNDDNEMQIETAGDLKVVTTEQPIEPPTAKPKFFFNSNEKIECVVNGFYNKETGMIEFVVPGEIKEDSERFNVVKHVFYFTRIPYNRLNTYRSQSMIYNQADRTNSVNVLKLREFFWLFHLNDWNFEDENGKKLELKHDPSGALSDESLELLNQLPANILDVAISVFERKINVA